RFFVSPRHVPPLRIFMLPFGTESQGFFLVALFNFQGAVAVPLLRRLEYNTTSAKKSQAFFRNFSRFG
ncbi:MAG: hypothetical protein K6E36_02195, partial [Oscillospiraceae bacterium]|nr:hypothetical protein [Oscillospiraceae bacterium]